MLPCHKCGQDCQRNARVTYDGYRFCDTVCRDLHLNDETAKREAARLVPQLPGFVVEPLPREVLVLVAEEAM
jgi:hypothetical protein